VIEPTVGTYYYCIFIGIYVGFIGIYRDLYGIYGDLMGFMGIYRDIYIYCIYTMYIHHILNPSTCWFQASNPKKTAGWLHHRARPQHLRDIGHRAFIGMETELTRNGRCWIYLDIPW